MIKKLKIELFIFGILVLNIILPTNFNLDLYSKFYIFDGLENNINIKNFFINLTEIGDSLWFFLISIFGYFFCYFLKKITKNNFVTAYNKLKAFFLFLFISILFTGLLTQLTKHLIGRPRPNYAIKNEKFNIDFFSFDSAYHSFPSGHTSTIFIVALTLALFTPKIKYFYLFFAALVGVSRVVVGAHYLTDVIGGITIAFIGFKITLVFFNKFNFKKHISPIKMINSNIFFLSLIIFAIGIVFISVGNTLDIYISSLFYFGEQQFILQKFDAITFLTRQILLPFLIIYLLILPIVSLFAPINKIYFSYKFSKKDILFIFISSIVNLLVVVNLILKNFWGRVRPNEILQLGGQENFTAWFQYSNGCSSNCSFVSGDASVGFSLISLYFITKKNNFFWLSLFLGFFIGTIRILEGGHFFSDILMAVFFIFILTFLQFNLYEKNLKNDL